MQRLQAWCMNLFFVFFCFMEGSKAQHMADGFDFPFSCMYVWMCMYDYCLAELRVLNNSLSFFSPLSLSLTLPISLSLQVRAMKGIYSPRQFGRAHASSSDSRIRAERACDSGEMQMYVHESIQRCSNTKTNRNKKGFNKLLAPWVFFYSQRNILYFVKTLQCKTKINKNMTENISFDSEIKQIFVIVCFLWCFQYGVVGFFCIQVSVLSACVCWLQWSQEMDRTD